jgi:hypothetical protein
MTRSVFSWYIVGCAVVSMIALVLMPKPHASVEDVEELQETQVAAR